MSQKYKNVRAVMVHCLKMLLNDGGDQKKHRFRGVLVYSSSMSAWKIALIVEVSYILGWHSGS